MVAPYPQKMKSPHSDPYLLIKIWKNRILNFFRITPKLFFAIQYIKNWTRVVPWNFFFVTEKKNS
jgi:hypothetical protein